MIKKLILIAVMGAVGLAWGSGDVTIQVISAVKEKSITHEFDKRLVKSGLAVHKVVEGGRYIVTLGSYKDEKSAQSALKKARTLVCADAFIRSVKRDQVAMTSHESTKSCKVMATTHKMTKVGTPVASHNESKEIVVAIVPRTEHVIVVEVKPVAVEVKNTPIAGAPLCPSVDKKEAYRNEIAEAISYYKNSPYHRFEPVMLQQ